MRYFTSADTTTCDGCGINIPVDEAYSCEHCENEPFRRHRSYCADCISQCEICDLSCCYEHSSQCATCGYIFCTDPDCGATCEACGKPVCISCAHLYLNESGDAVAYCPACANRLAPAPARPLATVA